jgi:hypothetical protein
MSSSIALEASFSRTGLVINANLRGGDMNDRLARPPVPRRSGTSLTRACISARARASRRTLGSRELGDNPPRPYAAAPTVAAAPRRLRRAGQPLPQPLSRLREARRPRGAARGYLSGPPPARSYMSGPLATPCSLAPAEHSDGDHMVARMPAGAPACTQAAIGGTSRARACTERPGCSRLSDLTTMTRS